jgi:N-acetylglucosaminyl-diphospho-decaprenol L-rhamnosyltransferase
MTLAVQVVNYKTRAYLERCIASVLRDLEPSGLEYEIHLLDNASGDDLSAFEDRCSVHVADRNLGFGAGHNLLASMTGARHLLILNPDVEFIAADTARRLGACVEEPGVTAAGPKLVTGEGVAQQWDHGLLHGVRAQISYRAGASYWRDTTVRQDDVAWVSGASMIVEHAAFEAIGGFDEQFFLYKEDEDLCLRLREAGGRVVYEPSIVVRHTGSVVADRSEELGRAIDYFVSKHFPNRRAQRAYSTAHRLLPYLRI